MSWQPLYGDAIRSVLQCIGERTDADKVSLGESVLLKYNTRVNFREYEVSSDLIFSELFRCWNIAETAKIEPAKNAFYSFFQSGAVAFADAISVLQELKVRGLKVGVLTDAAYGAERQYALPGINQISPYVDAFLTSVDVGFRKPDSAGYLQLADELKVNVTDCMFVGDEEKDIIGANRVGMPSILISRQGRAADYGQKHTVRSLDEIIGLLPIEASRSELDLRPITGNVLDGVLAVYHQCEDFLSLGPEPSASIAMVQNDIGTSRAEGGLFSGVYNSKDNLIGVVDFVPDGYEGFSSHAYISLLMIAAPFRNQGIGTQVVNLIETEVRKNPQVTTIRCAVQVNNPGALRFWQHHGYRITGGPELRPDHTTVFHLRKDLAHPQLDTTFVTIVLFHYPMRLVGAPSSSFFNCGGECCGLSPDRQTRDRQNDR